MERLLDNIVKYIGHLASSGFGISLHFKRESINKLPYAVWSRLLPFNSHNNPYCLAVKAQSADRCIGHQECIISSLGDCGECRECYAGVLEYIYPVAHQSKTVGYIAISGYRGDHIKSDASYSQHIDSLSKSRIPEAELEALLPPLSVMLERLFELAGSGDDNEHNMMSQYLAENHTSLSFDDFCRHFSRSRSYMSHKFINLFGASFSDYCNRLRLSDAERLLRATALSVTEIAFASGFGDVSYFIRLFRTVYGQTPHKYRKAKTAQ